MRKFSVLLAIVAGFAFSGCTTSASSLLGLNDSTTTTSAASTRSSAANNTNSQMGQVLDKHIDDLTDTLLDKSKDALLKAIFK